MRKAVYHLPGLFEFYELYRAFLPLFRKHRDWFSEESEIGSIYGAPSDCLGGGGRVEDGECNPREVLALLEEYGISARLTFSNSLLEEKHLADARCNALCTLFEKSGVSNGVVVHSELLTAYLRENYPGLYLVSSTTKVLTDFEQLRAETARAEFRYVVPDFRLNKAFAQPEKPRAGWNGTPLHRARRAKRRSVRRSDEESRLYPYRRDSEHLSADGLYEFQN